MSELLLVAAWLFPLALIALLFTRLQGLLPIAALPALTTAILVPSGTDIELPWLLLGSQFGLDAADRVFLMFSAIIWFVAGAQSELTMRDKPGFRRFGVFFLLAMSGNFWLILGQDMVNFYLGFSLMGFAAYGLVIYNRDPEALRAGRIYLVMTLLAEVSLLTAFMLIFMHTQDLAPTAGQIAGVSSWAIALLLLGLGIKAGFLFLHMWLPLSYTAAPAPAAAVLSGAMSKVALLGWIRYLPLGEVMFWDWGMLLVILGALATVYAIVIGLLQTNPKTILAYSSISKMGLMGILLGLGMMQPELSDYVVIAVVFFAAYHGLTKGALFLGVGIINVISSRWVFGVLILLSLIMMGAPLTAGAMHKSLIKPVIEGFDGYWPSFIPALLVVATTGTTLMMMRFLSLIHSGQAAQTSSSNRIALPWVMLATLVLLLPFVLSYDFPSFIDGWPVLFAMAIAIVILRFSPDFIRTLPGRIPPGDIIALFDYLYRLINQSTKSRLRHLEASLKRDKPENMNQLQDEQSIIIRNVEKSLAAWQISGILFMVLAIALFTTLWLVQ
jgi:formate hydrogenlyase subunit 3/multisubunit Na+/H+ antiporter MnhD subunit